jgi:hypothetical protein
MSKEKQIEEMAKALNEATFGVNTHTFADHLKPETINKVAEYLYNAGYRKQSAYDLKIGDKIYEVIEDSELKGGVGIFQLTVTEVGQNHIWVSAYNPPRDDFDVNYPISEIGKSIFFTREEAKESLKVAQ